MKRRTSMLPVGLLVAVAISLSGCDEVCPSDPLDTMEPVDLGIDTDLHAVVALDNSFSDRLYPFFGVGASGTVVAWGVDTTGEHYEPIVDVFDLGDLDLRAAWIDRYAPQSWWVVGDGALVMVSHNHGATWESVELQTSANLYGITSFANRPIVVGDDVIAMRTVDGTWTELVPPAGGWGQLRAIGSAFEGSTTRVIAVGLGGVIWSTIDPSGTWTLEPSGVTTDLLAVGNGVVVGRQGTMLRRNPTDGTWTPANTGVTVDLVGCARDRVLGANGEIYETSEPLTLIETVPGARGLSDTLVGWATVGDGGSASSPPIDNCVCKRLRLGVCQ
jgi:photosystem II stability/assembly factor-like uncharacterized protein